MRRLVTLLLAGLMLLGSPHGNVARGQEPPDPIPPPASPATKDSRPALAGTPRIEQQTLHRLLQARAWPRRAVAAMRLERYGDEVSRDMLLVLLRDDVWQVRAFALRALARRGEPQGDDWLAEETEPRVVRAALRHRYTIDPDRLKRGVEALRRANDFDRRLLGVEIAAASGQEALVVEAMTECKKIIHRMDRVTGGSLSPRLAALTGQPDLRRHHKWKRWALKTGRRFDLRPAWALAEDGPPPPLSQIAALAPDAFARLEQYMQELGTRDLDLAIVIDCTASMYGELSEAQGDIDDLMLFLGDVLRSARVGVVAYRDRREEFETQGWDFTSDIDEARQRLWQLTASGGGDSPEAVYPALKLAYAQLDWQAVRTKVLVLVGDGPPHVGYGSQCVELARRGAAIELVTHVIEADGRAVKHFAEIAEAGGGRNVTLEDGDSLIAEITGLSLGDLFEEEFREFFRVYLQLCR
ncbi:MAG: HEAT repeat domain-containing protein [Planctomycetota bacterium]|jgi:hypothetical protein